VLLRYYSGDQIKGDEMRRACGTYAGDENACRILVGKVEGSRPHERPRLRWKDNVKMHIKEIGWEDMDWICLALLNMKN
jgi:hypothetical protein